MITYEIKVECTRPLGLYVERPSSRSSVAGEAENRVVKIEVRDASKEGRDARPSRSHEVHHSLRPRFPNPQKVAKKEAKKIWLTLNPGPPAKPHNKCNPISPHHGEDLSAE